MARPQWPTVIKVVSDGHYVVRYPDGSLELVVDDETSVADEDAHAPDAPR